jgi:hypothetical protein
MTLSGLQCAIVIKELAEYLDRDAHDVLRTGLEPFARDGLAFIGRDDIADDHFAVRSVANWMARVPSAAGWVHRAERQTSASRTTETRIPRELFQLDFDATAIARLTQFMAERTQRDSTAERLITARQRRRNINSQTRQMVKPLDMGWLDGHLDRALPSWKQEEIVGTAHQLSTQQISEPIDIDRWREEVPKFRADFISADAAESPRHRDSSSGGATARTYRASWTKFWRDNDLIQVLMRLLYEESFAAEVLRMLSEDDGSERHLLVPIRRPGVDEMLRFPVLSTSYRGSSLTSESGLSEPRFSSPERFTPIIDEPYEALESPIRTYENSVSPALATNEPVMAEKVRFTFHPHGKPGDAFSRTWPSAAAARDGVPRFIRKCAALSADVGLWDFTVSLSAGPEVASLGRASLALEDLVEQANTLVEQAQYLL